MKKFLLVAVAALAVVACKKDKDEPVNPNGGNGNGNGSAQTEQPTPVPAGFVKQTIQTMGGANTITTTYKVENNVLKSWAVTNSQGKTVTHTLSYDGKNLKTYHYQDEVRALDEVYTFGYENNKLTKITYASNNQTDTFTISTDDKGRITAKENKGVGNFFNSMPWKVTFEYGENSLKVVNNSDSGTATYTYTYENGNVKKIETINYQRVVDNYEYDTTVENELSNPYILLANLARLNVRGHSGDVSFGQEQDIYVAQSKNVVKKFMFYTYDITKENGKVSKIVKKDNAGNPMRTIEYRR